MKIDWVRKLTSRKLWMAIASEVGMIMIFCGSPDSEVKQVTAMIIGGASIIAYIIGEGLADAGSTDVSVVSLPKSEVSDEEKADEES